MLYQVGKQLKPSEKGPLLRTITMSHADLHVKFNINHGTYVLKALIFEYRMRIYYPTCWYHTRVSPFSDVHSPYILSLTAYISWHDQFCLFRQFAAQKFSRNCSLPSKEPPPNKHNHKKCQPPYRPILFNQQLPVNPHCRPLILPRIVPQPRAHLSHPL